ncbi:MAG: NUDIX hydrolase [Vicinamibacterales bacterium]
MTVDRVRLPHGRELDLEVVRHPASVVIVPMASPTDVVLIRQYRYVIDRWVWELPAGSVDGGEDTDAAARRECHEEIGLRPTDVQLLARLFPTPGYCDEEMFFYRASGLERPGEDAAKDEDEVIEPRVFSLDEARAMVARGDIIDMKTVVGLSLLA